MIPPRNHWHFSRLDKPIMEALKPGDVVFARHDDGKRLVLREEKVIRVGKATVTCERGTYWKRDGKPYGRDRGFVAYPRTDVRIREFEQHRARAQALAYLSKVDWGEAATWDLEDLLRVTQDVMRAREQIAVDG